jgi:hypothetical protein
MPTNQGKSEKAETTKKRVYKHIMPKEEVLISLTESDLIIKSEADTETGVQVKKEQLSKLFTDEKSTEYYWRIVFSYSFLMYKQKRHRLLNESQSSAPFSITKPLKKITLKHMAVEAGIDYYKIKKLFRGKGNADSVLQYILFLNRYDISFVVIANQQALIAKAFKYYLLVQNGFDPEDTTQLTF